MEMEHAQRGYLHYPSLRFREAEGIKRGSLMFHPWLARKLELVPADFLPTDRKKTVIRTPGSHKTLDFSLENKVFGQTKSVCLREESVNGPHFPSFTFSGICFQVETREKKRKRRAGKPVSLFMT